MKLKLPYPTFYVPRGCSKIIFQIGLLTRLKLLLTGEVRIQLTEKHGEVK